ncbi:hypothetical protein LINPERHAP1_LOCUS12084 [Linum perenne]
MEDEKKKRRNKKKKNKQQQQNKASEDDASTDHTSNAGNDHQATVRQNGAPPNTDGANAGSVAHRGDNGLDESILAEAQKKQLQQRETDLKEEINRLHKENEWHEQKEADLEEKIKELLDQNDSQVQKQASLEGSIKALISANDTSVVKEADSEEKINQLKSEKNTYIQKEADLEMRIAQLQHEKDLWLEKENVSKETIGKQSIDITRLRMQVVELEENKSSLLKENQMLVERVSDLQSRVQSLETGISSASTTKLTKNPSDENDNVNPQVEAAHVLINKLITENAELVDKVNELYVKLDKKDRELDRSSDSESDGRDGSSEFVGTLPSPADSLYNIPSLNRKLTTTEVAPTVARIPVPSEADSAEIVQISLNNSEVEEDPEIPTAELDNEPTPLTDAPLIGAPFRLISFVASYVSGADLVNKS